MITKCPTCNKMTEPDSIHRPFCSDRCRLIDLGDWLTGSFRVMENEIQDVWIDPENPETRH